MIPVNKQASIFLSRKKRVETVQQALEVFAEKLTTPDVVQNIIDMMASDTDGKSPCLEIAFKIHRDEATPTAFAVKMRTKVSTHLRGENFYGLK